MNDTPDTSEPEEKPVEIDLSNARPSGPQDNRKDVKLAFTEEDAHRQNISLNLIGGYLGFIFTSFLSILGFIFFLVYTDGEYSEAMFEKLHSLTSELVTALTGIVGSIIGFYFGSRSK